MNYLCLCNRLLRALLSEMSLFSFGFHPAHRQGSLAAHNNKAGQPPTKTGRLTGEELFLLPLSLSLSLSLSPFLSLPSLSPGFFVLPPPTPIPRSVCVYKQKGGERRELRAHATRAVAHFRHSRLRLPFWWPNSTYFQIFFCFPITFCR